LLLVLSVLAVLFYLLGQLIVLHSLAVLPLCTFAFAICSFVNAFAKLND